MRDRRPPRTRAREVLVRLIRARVPGRYGYFFVSGEGTFFPDGSEDASGNVIDGQGRVFFFWTGWDVERGEPMLRIWEPDEPEPRWGRSAEYRRARAAAGLNDD